MADLLRLPLTLTLTLNPTPTPTPNQNVCGLIRATPTPNANPTPNQNVSFMADCIKDAGLKTFLIAKTGTPID